MIQCEHPRLILNPNIAELVGKYHHYYLNGQWYYNRYGHLNLYKFNKKPFNQLLAKHIVNIDNYENHYVVDKTDGSAYPIYLCVPCGHCVLCKEKKVNSFVSRIKYESFLYPYKPLFLTLTYNNQWLPEDGVSVRDVQLFLKRLRQNLYRGGFVQRIRYVIVAEYGRRTHRAHYHAIIFGLPVRDDRDLRRFRDILNKSWPLGYTLSRQVDMSNDRCAYYTSKYLRKDCNIPDGCKSTFCNSSRGHGGIGSGFFKEQAKLLRKRVCTDPKVLNPWTNKTEPMMWSKYALDKIYPTMAISIPLKLRKALKTWCRCYHTVKDYEPDLLWLFEDTHQRIKSAFGDLLYLPFDGLDTSLFFACFSNYNWGDIYDAEKIVAPYLDTDFSNAPDLVKKRAFLVSNLSLNQCDVDLVQKVAKIKRNIKRSQMLEVL